MPRFATFRPQTIAFLGELKSNNNREWFNDNKARYEELVLDVALNFIQSMHDPLRTMAPNFTAIPKRMGGSLMRVYRDTRFSKNKLPYKTNIGIQFRHEQAKNVHSPGYYVHIDPEQCLLFDMEADPMEHYDLSRNNGCSAVINDFRAMVDEHWNLDAITQFIHLDQRRRNFVQSTHFVGRQHVSWDYQPVIDGSKLYHRSHISWLEADKRDTLRNK